jgi:hypothetical protein
MSVVGQPSVLNTRRIQPSSNYQPGNCVSRSAISVSL